MKIIALCVAACLAASTARAAPNQTTLLSLNQGGPRSHAYANPVWIGPDGGLYGVTVPYVELGKLVWSLYKLTPGASGQGPWSQTVLASFGGPSAPDRLASGPDGSLYGALSSATPDPDFPQFSVLHAEVFRLVPPGGARTTWRKDVLTTSSDGTFGNLVVDSHSHVFGSFLRQNQDTFEILGTSVFELIPATQSGSQWTRRTLHDFTMAEGSGISGPLLLRGPYGSTTLFGMATQGGARNCGTVFRVAVPRDTSPAGFAKLFEFNCGAGGGSPAGGLAANAAGALFGITLDYLGDDDQYHNGLVFRLAPPGPGPSAWTETALYKLPGHPPGLNIGPLLIGPDGRLFGVINQGGPAQRGSVFSLTPRDEGGQQIPWNLATLFAFDGRNGLEPSVGLSGQVRAGVFALYGSTEFGGPKYPSQIGDGVVFRVIP